MDQVAEIRARRKRILECRKEIARLEAEIDSLLELDTTRRPARGMLSREGKRALLADAVAGRDR